MAAKKQSTKCTIIIRKVPKEQFRLPDDGRKWRQSARSRKKFLLYLSTWANGDGTFVEKDEDGNPVENGKNYSPSERTIAKDYAEDTYYRLSKDLQKLGWLSWTREQHHYGRRFFTIRLVPIPPKTPLVFESEQVSDSSEEADSEQVPPSEHMSDSPENTSDVQIENTSDIQPITPLLSRCDNTSAQRHHPSYPDTSLESSACDLGSTRDHGHAIDAQSARTKPRASTSSPASASESRRDKSLSHVSKENPSVQPNRRAGRLDFPSVRKNDGGAESVIDFAVADEPVSSAAENAGDPFEIAATQRRLSKQGKRDYAIDKSKEWRDLAKEIRDRMKVLVKRLEPEWEHWATHDDDGDVLSEEDRKVAFSFPCPSDTTKLMLAGLLQTYTDLQVIRVWNKFLRRAEGFGGLDFPRTAVWSLFEREFEIFVESEEESAEKVQHHQPPLEAFVAGLRAELDYDGWIAKCPCAYNHEHGDENFSLVINRGEKVPVIVHCRAGCDKNEVWKQALEKAREVIDSGEALPALPEGKVKSKKEFDVAPDIAVILHARLNQVPEVQSWLKKWGITSDVADKLQLGASPVVEFTREDRTKFESPALIIPHFDHAGKLIGLKARAMSEKCFKQQEGSSIGGLFATAHLNPEKDEVYVFEGDKDVAIAMSHGFNATGILSAGSSVSDADIALLAKYKMVYLFGDQDKAGIAAMDRLAKRLPEERVTRIHLPVKDVGELFEKHRLDFRQALETILHGQVVGSLS